ncbi:MAG: DUF1553 domain-containing protein [Planctomycetia bacterium]|nr:DUF1553 domain-containing protein [Planctomycetia bacterium]
MTGLRLALLSVFLLVAVACLRAAGADASPAAPAEPPITDSDRAHWAYRPLSSPAVPTVADPRWSRSPVDRFVKAALEQRRIEPVPRAGKATLLRRLSFDLTGLPPTPQALAAFENDESPDAYEKLVDRLLASPAYGERFAQHWLDLARFAETDGFEHDLLRPNAWRYRDWVIGALARDMPYDEFVRLQIAGDELVPGDPDAAVATGFLLCGPDMPDLNLPEERRHNVLNEMTATVGSALLGLQVGCAQCHDHKYDPISQHDFYRLRAFLDSADCFRDHPIPSVAELAARQAAEDALPVEDRQRAERLRELEELGASRFRDENPDVQPSLKDQLARLTDDERKEHAALVEAVKALPKLPEVPLARVMRDGQPRDSYLYVRGDFRQKGPVVSCGFPRVVAEGDSQPTAAANRPRAALAAWLTRPDHPLATRVIVNRIWQWHFGAGLVASASDFGVMGNRPTHPELLDWLAERFVADGWSMKKMHKLLVTSETYQLAASAFDADWPAERAQAARATWNAAAANDPEDELLWRRRRTRLSGEAIRDAMLAACDRLSPRHGGPGVRPPLPPEVTGTLLKDQWRVTENAEDHRRRSIYLFVRRNLRYPLFDVFDRPDANASCPRRHESTTATQSLVLFNSQFSLDCARYLAGALPRAQPTDDARRIEDAYLRVFGRRPSGEEAKIGAEFLTRQAERLRHEARETARLAQPAGCEPSTDPFATAALVDFCLALMNANEFVYVE